jgi:hypothetical protein
VICPECQVEFKGGGFYQTGAGRSRRMRECPNGHRFEEPPRARRSDAIDARRYRWLRRQVAIRRDLAAPPTPDVSVHLDRGYIHGMGIQFASAESIEAESLELDDLIDAALSHAPPP